MSKFVGVCAFFRHDQFATGAYSFVENLLRGLAALRRSLPVDEQFQAVVFQGLQGLAWSDEQMDFRQIPDRWGRWPAEARAALLESANFDGILFPNTFTPPLVRAERAVTVIHDLQYIHLPEYWPLAKRVWMRACHEFSLRKCHAVVAISQTVKDDILTHYGARWESRVHAIWNPVSLQRFDEPVEPPVASSRPYILCAAADRPYKNIATLVRAFAKVRERLPEYRLVLAGQLRSDCRGWMRRDSGLEAKLPSAANLVVELGLSQHVDITGYITDSQLGALYRGATLFVLPSLFEGFGMPAVESLALGTPTLVSDLPVLREVTLNGANYIADPLEADQMAEQIRHLLARGDAARPEAQFSREIRDRFAPETIARQYLKLLAGY
jgi:glycosyltransferase involved in cell wall biosynthesis